MKRTSTEDRGRGLHTIYFALQSKRPDRVKNVQNFLTIRYCKPLTDNPAAGFGGLSAGHRTGFTKQSIAFAARPALASPPPPSGNGDGPASGSSLLSVEWEDLAMTNDAMPKGFFP